MLNLLTTLITAVSVALAAAPAPQQAPRPRTNETALDRYVAAPDASFSWKVLRELPGSDGASATLLEMTSQRFLTEQEVERPLWTHWVTVVRPAKVTSDIGFLFITGGSLERKPPSSAPPWMVEMARDTGTVITELRLVPNQPIVFTDDPLRKPRTEDDFIAYTWAKFLMTGDEKWPARLPMTKSAVRAMDAVTAFAASPAGGGAKVSRFVVSGASKRGWTAWATAAVDKRVVAVAPIVIDLLNIEPSFVHHWRAYGAWSDAVEDYVHHGVMNWMGTPQFRALMKIEEPYEYRDRLTMPKFIMNASGDQFFLPDSSQFYFDQLGGEKHVRYVPNAGHSLEKTDAIESLQSFYASVVSGTPRPEVRWTFEKDGSIKVVAKQRPTEVRLWQATNAKARNFRHDTLGSAYTSTVLQPSGPNTWVGRAAKPEAGWTAFFVELAFPTGGKHPLKVTSGVRVTPDTLPFAAPEPKRITDADPTPFDRETRMTWWRDARFGMFIHWGLYALPAGEYQGKKSKEIGEWIMSWANIPRSEYEQFAPKFNPVKFDAAEWVRVAKNAGMKYLVITSKHHDGFAMYDSAVSKYDIVDATPYKKDPMRALADECRKQGLKFAFYYSIMDWHHPSQYVQADEKHPEAGHSKTMMKEGRKQEYVDYMKAQLRELVTNYDPAVLWFDGEWVDWWTEEDGQDLYRYVRGLKPGILINNRVGKGRRGMEGLNKTDREYSGDFGTPEQQIPPTGLRGTDWETCMTMNDTWGFKSYDENWKSNQTLVRQLVDAASKGGNYLLNVGPTAEGQIPSASVERLAAIGKWMSVNRDAIYETSASPFTVQLPWGRATRKEDRLYLHVFDWPAGGTLNVPAFGGTVVGARLMGAAAPLKVSRSVEGFGIEVPATAPDPIASVVVLQVAPADRIVGSR